jgi:muconolactone delta-isomerase
VERLTRRFSLKARGRREQQVRYLVTFEGVEAGPLLPPQQVPGLLRSVVFPTQEALAELESEGKVRGGVTAGARSGAFILDADSHDEANQIVQSLPSWGIVKIQMTPLQSFETRRQQDGQFLERLEAGLQQ